MIVDLEENVDRVVLIVVVEVVGLDVLKDLIFNIDVCVMFRYWLGIFELFRMDFFFYVRLLKRKLKGIKKWVVSNCIFVFFYYI